jgi:hypothetical protein
MTAVRRLLTLILVACTLSACRVDATVSLVVKPDGSGSITLTAVADAAVLQQAPGLAADLRFADATAAGWTVVAPASTADGGLKVVISHPFASVEEATALLRSLSGSGGPLHDITLTRSVTPKQVTTVLGGTLRVDGGLDAFADPDLLATVGGSPYAADIAAAKLKASDAVGITFTVTLPGTIVPASTAGSGTAPAVQPGAPRSWTVPLDRSSIDVATTAVVSRAGRSNGWSTIATAAFVGLAAWCVLAAGFIGFVARARRARTARRPSRP